jgi:TrmH family RNA methyltransferase
MAAPIAFPRIENSRDPLLARYRDLSTTAGRREHGQMILEGPLLVERALKDRLPLDSLLFTLDLLKRPDAKTLLEAAMEQGVRGYQLSEGLLGKLTTTRPVPEVVCALRIRLRDTTEMAVSAESALLMVENVTNPDNLGMILRTADALGSSAVIIAGEKTDPLHKNCARAARGAVGRLPLFTCPDPPAYLQDLRQQGLRIIGATGQGETELYHCELKPPLIVIVGNEQEGVTPELLALCGERVRIPMVPGQDSLNVGVAAGIFLYEVQRQRAFQPS